MQKDHYSAILGVILALILAWGCSQKPAKEGAHSYSVLKQLFPDPPSEYRSAPLWDWNDRITEAGIDFQMKAFKKAGIGGVFVHPRPGLITEYLSDEWFQLFDYTVQKGKALDLQVWIYDENSYPSGFAGGHVPAEMPDAYRHGTGLSLEMREDLNINLSDTVAVVLRKTGSDFTDITASADKELGQTGNYYVFRKTYPAQSPWYGGFTYVDLLYPGVTEKFLELTMTRGYERNRADFGKTLPGIFTDEPNLEAALSHGSLLRWTPDLWDAFQRRWGYNLQENLPALIEQVGNWKKVRHDYYELLLELFVERWAKPWSRYCAENGLKWTGHYWEHGWPEPTDGSDESAFYIWHQMPGVDMLGNRLDSAGLGGQFGNDRAVRELLSAANQAGRRRTLSETYGGGGWEMTFETQKRLVDWQCVLGVNFVNQHLSYYSLNGVRKFDYPPSFSYHEPWWEHYKLMGDYIGRLCLAMATGAQINHTLVLQPNTTAWMYFSRKQKNAVIDTIRHDFKNLVYRMEQKHLEYDLGSEQVLKVLGRVKGKKLVVGQRAYSLVVIPAEMENIDRSTYNLLLKFLENGGQVLSFRSQIQLLDGAPSPLPSQLMAQSGENWLVADGLDDPGALELLTRGDFNLKDLSQNGMLYHQRRQMDDGQLLLLVNSHPGQKARAEISAIGQYASLLDLMTGKIYAYPAQIRADKLSFQIELEPAGSALFAITMQKPTEPEYHPVSGTETVMPATGALTVKRESDNVMMVNYLDLKTAHSDKKDVYFMTALNGLFQEHGIEMGNPWQHKIQYKKTYLALDTLFTADSGFEVSYHFRIHPSLGAEAMQSIRAVVERHELWTVSVNGNPVTTLGQTYWIEQQFPVYAVGQYLKPGRNTLTLTAPRMHILAEVMPIYLLGDFLVKPASQDFEITGGEPGTIGSWRAAGLPFYSDKVAYTQTFQLTKSQGTAFKVRLNQWSGSLAEVWVNGKSAGPIAFPPYELEVSDLLRDGSNEIVVKVIGSLKNTFGPFYQKNDSWIFGPFSWNQAPATIPPASDYFLIDYGLMAPFDLVLVK